MNLETKYMGIPLKHPLMVGAGPLSDDLDMVRALEDSGAAAIALRSLYEEDILSEQMHAFYNWETHANSFAEATDYEPEPEFPYGPDEYLEHLRRVKQAVSVPVFGSLNAVTPGSWTSIARMIEQAGADGIELNLYHPASDPAKSAAQVEQEMVDILRDVKQKVRIPVAVKLAPLFTAFAHFAFQLDAGGADAFVLFNRFHRVDIDVLEYEVIRTMQLSDSSELQQRLKGAAILSGRVKASIAITGGVHTALDVLKATMTGAHVTQMVSALLRNGPEHLRKVRADLESWMIENEWNSLNEMRGNMGFDKVPDPASYERANFRIMLR